MVGAILLSVTKITAVTDKIYTPPISNAQLGKVNGCNRSLSLIPPSNNNTMMNSEKRLKVR